MRRYGYAMSSGDRIKDLICLGAKGRGRAAADDHRRLSGPFSTVLNWVCRWRDCPRGSAHRQRLSIVSARWRERGFGASVPSCWSAIGRRCYPDDRRHLYGPSAQRRLREKKTPQAVGSSRGGRHAKFTRWRALGTVLAMREPAASPRLTGRATAHSQTANPRALHRRQSLRLPPLTTAYDRRDPRAGRAQGDNRRAPREPDGLPHGQKKQRYERAWQAREPLY